MQKLTQIEKKVFYQIIKKPYILCSESACFMLTVPEHGDPLPSPAGHTQLWTAPDIH